jgi:hypothetical protein
MVRRGHEIGSHSVWHKCPERPALRPADDRTYDATFEAKESRDRISDWMEMEISSFCYPFCRKGGGLKEAVAAAGYKQARAGHNAAYYKVGQPLDFFAVDCRLVGQDGRREDVRSWVQNSDEWHVLMFHGIGPISDVDGWMSITAEEFAREMAELAAHRDAGRANVMTFTNAAAHMRGVT